MKQDLFYSGIRSVYTIIIDLQIFYSKFFIILFSQIRKNEQYLNCIIIK